jgi:hypothetical protein
VDFGTRFVFLASKEKTPSNQAGRRACEWQPSDMKRRLWILGGVALWVAGCGQSMGVSGGRSSDLASTRIRTTSSNSVRAAVLAVFKEEGFTVVSESKQSITFSIAGGRRADIMWSTINNPNPVMIQPTVRWRNIGPGEILVECSVEVTQRMTAFGETSRKPMLAGKAAYNNMLRRVRQRVEAGQ